MTDTATVWIRDQGRGDWQVLGAGLQTGDDLTTAVLISLFTDRVANADDVIPDGTEDPRGWWGDAGETAPIGSRLWLLERSKQTSEVLNTARDYINEALAWVISDGVAARIDVLTEWTAASRLGAKVTIFRKNGTTVAMQFAWAWQGIN